MAFAPSAGLGPVTLISCVTDRIDAFVVGMDGGVYSSAWWSGATAWTSWKRVGTLQVAPCAPITAVSTKSGVIDLFAVDASGRIFNTWSHPVGIQRAYFWDWTELPASIPLRTTLHAPLSFVNVGGILYLLLVVGLDGRVYMNVNVKATGQWFGWFKVGPNDGLLAPGVAAPPGAPIGVAWIIRSGTDWEYELFVVGNDGLIYWMASRAGMASQNQFPLQLIIPNVPKISPRTPVTAIWRTNDKLDVFFTDSTSGLVKTVRLATTTGFPVGLLFSYTTALGGEFKDRTPVSAVSMAPDRVDIFAKDVNGSVVWNGNSPGESWTGNAFRVVNTDLFNASQPVAVGAVSRSLYKLDVAVARYDGFIITAAWELADLWTGFRGWWQIGSVQTGMRNPRVSEWTWRAVIFQKFNTAWSEEAQGVTTDGYDWFLTSNSKNYKSVIQFDQGFGILARLDLTDQGAHVSAADWFDGRIYVPLEKNQDSIWTAWTEQNQGETWELGLFSDISVGTTTRSNDTSYCAVNPLNGRLYTSPWNDGPLHMFAYDLEFANGEAVRRPEDDIFLGDPDREFTDIQGGVFTKGGRIILVRGTEAWWDIGSGTQTLFCFSAITGDFLGSRDLNPDLDNRGGDSDGREVESVTVSPRWLVSDGRRIDVHVFELLNNETRYDDCFLHSFSVPNPDEL